MIAFNSSEVNIKTVHENKINLFCVNPYFALGVQVPPPLPF